MRKLVFALLLLALAGGGYVYMTTGARQHAPIGVMLQADTRRVSELSQKFLEDIQFKDFKAAAQYSSPEDRQTADIPKLIERLFQIKPELLDLQRYEIVSADLDSTKKRARVKLLAEVKLLNSGQARKPEVLLYWKKAPSGEWHMDLASSLQ